MEVGDLVVNIHSEEFGIITDLAENYYVIVDNKWLIPEDHLEVVCK